MKFFRNLNYVRANPMTTNKKFNFCNLNFKQVKFNLIVLFNIKEHQREFKIFFRKEKPEKGKSTKIYKTVLSLKDFCLLI